MSIALGSSEISKVYLGGTEVSKAYLGSTEIWSNTPSVLPYDAEIEYLESSGTQYIQLSLSVTAGTYFAIETDIIPFATSGKYAIFGSYPSNQFSASFYSYSSSTNRSTFSSRIGNVSTNGGFGLDVGTTTSLILSTEGITRDGSLVSVARPLTTALTEFRLFGAYINSSRHPVRFCNFKIIAGDSTLYNFIPVRVGSVGYMYDTISRNLYGNSGTGNFILGSDK